MSHSRYVFLDSLRGLALVNMIAYHLFWNLEHLVGVPLAWYHSGLAQIWQLCICGTFLLLAGMCIRFSRHLLRHIGILALCAGMITWITSFTGEGTLIVFGILHCMTGCFVIFLVLCPWLERISPRVLCIVCLLAFAVTYHLPYQILGFGWWQISLPEAWYTVYWLSPLGLLAPQFRSADYFPIVPYLFLFLAGYGLSGLTLPKWMKSRQILPLSWMGQHSLLIYLVHQPVLYGLMLPVM